MASLLLLLIIASCLTAASANFNKEVEVTWGNGRGKILENGRHLTLSLDNYSGSGFQSKSEYLFGRVDMMIKLVAGDSAGTVTTYYLSSQGETHDEVDFEFLGNVSGEPYTVHTNVFAQGKGDREQQFQLWFDPTKAFHTYSIDWNPQRIIWLVDNSPIRVFHNNEAYSVSFPKNQPMRVYSSLWNADDWATQGGRVKTNWTNAPFIASYRNYKVTNACVHSSASPCTSKSSSQLAAQATQSQGLDENGRKRVRWVQQRHMIYNYCSDRKRFPGGLPKECNRPRFL